MSKTFVERVKPLMDELFATVSYTNPRKDWAKLTNHLVPDEDPVEKVDLGALLKRKTK